MLGSTRNLCLRGQAISLCLAVLAGLGAFSFLEQGVWRMLVSGITVTLALTVCAGFCPIRFIVKKTQEVSSDDADQYNNDRGRLFR